MVVTCRTWTSKRDYERRLRWKKSSIKPLPVEQQRRYVENYLKDRGPGSLPADCSRTMPSSSSIDVGSSMVVRLPPSGKPHR
ncbi:MAG: hypothetical protein R3A10_13070 [Caldilineaceae bacterium]